MVPANGWPRSGNVVTTPMLLRKSFVATATLGAASEWRGHMGSTRASAKHALTTERMKAAIDRRDFICSYAYHILVCSASSHMAVPVLILAGAPAQVDTS